MSIRTNIPILFAELGIFKLLVHYISTADLFCVQDLGIRASPSAHSTSYRDHILEQNGVQHLHPKPLYLSRWASGTMASPPGLDHALVLAPATGAVLHHLNIMPRSPYTHAPPPPFSASPTPLPPLTIPPHPKDITPLLALNHEATTPTG